MKSVFFHGFSPEEGALRILKEKGLLLVDKINAADVIVYQGTLLDILENCEKKVEGNQAPKVDSQAIIPYKMFLINKGIEPIGMDGQSSLGKKVFSDENIRGVSDGIGDLVDSLDKTGQFSDMSRYLKANSLELVQNGLIYKRVANKGGSVELEILETSMFFNIRVRDPFGGLTKEKILSKLFRASAEKTYEDKESGAGLGLFMVLNASDCVIFKLKEGRQTEVCCIINKYKRLKEFKNKSPALFIFEQDSKE